MIDLKDIAKSKQTNKQKNQPSQNKGQSEKRQTQLHAVPCGMITTSLIGDRLELEGREQKKYLVK